MGHQDQFRCSGFPLFVPWKYILLSLRSLGCPGGGGSPGVPRGVPGVSAYDAQAGKEEHPPRGNNPSGEARPEPYGTTPQVFWDSFRLLPHPRRLDRHRQVSVRFPTRPPDGATRTLRRGAGRAGWGGCLSVLRQRTAPLSVGLQGTPVPHGRVSRERPYSSQRCRSATRAPPGIRTRALSRPMRAR